MMYGKPHLLVTSLLQPLFLTWRTSINCHVRELCYASDPLKREQPHLFMNCQAVQSSVLLFYPLTIDQTVTKQSNFLFKTPFLIN